MSWSDNNNNNPWGSQGGGNGRGQGPDMDNVIRDLQNKFKGFIPGSFFGKLGPTCNNYSASFDLACFRFLSSFT
jgi:hypothetical protein